MRDPVLDDTDRFYREQAEFERSRPICAGCGYPIMSDTCCEINGEYYCEDCFTVWDTEDVDI